MFQKRHFKALAKVISEAHTPRNQKLKLTNALVDIFKKDNPRFDKQRFFAACGLDCQ